MFTKSSRAFFRMVWQNLRFAFVFPRRPSRCLEYLTDVRAPRPVVVHPSFPVRFAHAGAPGGWGRLLSLGAASRCRGAATGHSDAVAPAADGKRIILMTNGNSPFWDACRVGMQAAEKEFKLAEAGLTAVLEVNDGTAKGQLDLLRQYGSQSDIVGVAITVTDSENVAIAEELKNLQAKGVVTVIMDSDFKGELTKTREFFIGTNNTNAGKELGKCAAALRKDGGAYATFFGLSGAQNVVERCAGFAEGAGPAFQSKDSLEDNMDRTKAKENVRNALQNHPDIKTLVGIWSYNAPAIVDVVREAGTRKDVTIVVTDAEPIAIQEMEGGMIDAMVVQNPYAMGYDSTRLIKALLAKR